MLTAKGGSPTVRILHQLGPALTISLSLAVLLGCNPPTGVFQTATIDPHTLRMTFSGKLPFPPPAGQPFYQRSPAALGTQVQFTDAGGVPAPDLLTLSPDSIVSTRGKVEVLLRGPFGTVYLRTTLWYQPSDPPQPISFYADSWANSNTSNIPQTVAGIDQTAPLSAITLVRIFHAPPEFLIACATYNASGQLTVLSVNGSRHGDWLHSNFVQPLYKDLDIATSMGDRPRTRTFFGLPQRFPVDAFRQTGANPALPASLASERDVVNLHFDRNHFVRQDTFLPGQAPHTTFLRYPVTSAFPGLSAAESRMTFGDTPR